MNISLKIFLIIILLVQIFFTIFLIKSKKITMKYASLWIIALMLLIILALFPNIIIIISELFGFEVPSNMVFLLGFFVLFNINFIISLSLSKQNEKIKFLIQEVSILKKRLENYEGEE